MAVEVDMQGIDTLSGYFRTAQERADRAEVFAVSSASRFARAESSRQIRSQVNFTTSYLNQDGRLELTRSNGGKEATLTGRHRATSLANPIFNKTVPFFGRPRKGVVVKVRVARKGAGAALDGAFFVRLKGGNVGLAVRTENGRPPSRGAKPIFGGEAHLLYGPSVGQVAYDVFPDIAPAVGGKLADEFVRNFERL